MSVEGSFFDRWTDHSHCPYCAARTGNHARACSGCGRDLDLLRELRAEVTRLQPFDPQGPLAPLSSSPLIKRCISRCAWAIFLLLVSNVVIQFVFDAKLMYLQGAVFVIPMIFGYSLGIRLEDAREIGWAVIAAVITSAVAVLLMHMSVGVLDSGQGRGALFPANERDWKEFAQFTVTIASAFASGILFAQGVRWGVADSDGPGSRWLREWFMPQHFDGLKVDVRAARLKRAYAFIAAVISGAVSLVGLLHGRHP